MRVEDLLESHEDIEEWKASKKLCKSKRPDSSLGASALASCKSQGLRKRSGKKKITVGKRRVKVAGKKIKGVDYGGPYDDYKP